MAFEYPLVFLELVNFLCGAKILYKNEEESALGLRESQSIMSMSSHDGFDEDTEDLDP